jgi:hypothetical protein
LVVVLASSTNNTFVIVLQSAIAPVPLGVDGHIRGASSTSKPIVLICDEEVPVARASHLFSFVVRRLPTKMTVVLLAS